MLDDKEVMYLNILLVDDNYGDAKITKRAFEKSTMSHHIFVVNDGIEALDFLHKRNSFQDAQPPRPDFILLDINMPKLDGFETLERIKTDPQLKSIPVAMFSSSSNEQDLIKSYESGAVGFVPKPMTIDEFDKFVETFDKYWGVYNKLPRTIP